MVLPMPVMLTEGSVVERLRRHPEVRLDPHVAHAALLYDSAGARIMGDIWREYLAIGRQANLPMLILTPTWRATAERLARAGLAGRDVNGDAVRFLGALRREQADYAARVQVGGLMGCRGDCYLPAEALAEEQAVQYHAAQAESLARAGADLLFASTLPALCEACGMARAMAGRGVPYLLSFVVAREGALLDGTPLGEAIRRIDGIVSPPPLGYLANCIHTSIFAAALRRLEPALRPRVLGLQANTSSKTPAEFDGLPCLDTEPPDAFAQAMAALHAEFGLRILGGCCGTDGSHIRALAGRLTFRYETTVPTAP
ncbi:MAG: homocysteine S-methyltransferase family protein [Acidobacteria bacterium]|nr:homocysteine S-methyltransferase family protein [Acidobacteriota bacterium]